MQDDPSRPPTRHDTALDRTVRELERHVAGGGWDSPVRVFALVRTGAALAADPALAEQLPADVVAAARADPAHLTSVEQEGLPAGGSLEEILGQISWPPTVDGAAVVVERFVVPPEAERDLPDDPDAALQALLAHPERQDVRLAAAVLRGGSSSCALRSRGHDEDFAVGTGPDLAPGLVSALLATLED